MVSYALGHVREQADSPDLTAADDLVEAIVAAFVHHARRALGRGVLQGYQTFDESSLTLRGRLRVGDQIRRRFGASPPAEITFDDFTVDIEVNRLVLAATHRLLRLRLRSDRSRLGLRGVLARLDGVRLIAFDPRRLPPVHFDRLNERYRDVVELSKLILRSTTYELDEGRVPAAGFLVDMNKVFEDFLVAAIREALGPLGRHLVQGSTHHPLYLDEARRIALKPDLSLWSGTHCVWLGDAKYKRLVNDTYPNADLYQATAYAVATGLSEATLIYARSEGPPARYRIVHIGKTINVVALDLSAPPAELLAQVRSIADEIRSVAARRSAALVA
jgi:5-methylcytosine-specific restriction enzyme subunit McrC